MIAMLRRALIVVGLTSVVVTSVRAYPVDGFAYSGIRRIERLRLRLAGELEGPMPVLGGRKSIHDIKLHATAMADMDGLPERDPQLQTEIERLFSDRDPSYSLAVLDITPGRPVRYSSLRPERLASPGSVGKLVIATGLFSELARLYPDDPDARLRLLRERMITADRWIHHDHHKVVLFDVDTHEVGFRPIEDGDTFSLFEWADHMLSASANAAASTVWKEVMLMRAFGADYPPSKEDEEAFFEDTPRSELQRLSIDVVNTPLRQLGIAEGEWQLGTFFTRTGKNIVPGTRSYASPRALVLYLLRIEQGRVIDEWSSLELKRLIYMTEKRIRYASAPRLAKAAVYFKSGSLYRCKKEEGYSCGKYKGNVDNFMNSVATVETEDGRVYLVALMSNVLKINSAVEHQTLATYIERILAK
jgi:hypothetical protein